MGYLPRRSPQSVSEIKFEDAITVNVPLFIRLLELAREDIKNDPDLHFIAEKLVAISKEQPVATMEDYEDVLEYLNASRK